MRLLLDTHAFLWWLDGDAKLSPAVKKLIEATTTEVIVSAATGWEIATKARIGKLPKALPIARRLPEVVAQQGFTSLAITIEHGQRAGWLPGPHRDPFDRMLAAQALTFDIPIATKDRMFESFGVNVVW